MTSAVELHEYEEEEELPAWSLPAEAVDRIRVPVNLPEQVTREWAGSRGVAAGRGVEQPCRAQVRQRVKSST